MSKMLFVLLTINGNKLCETFCNRSLGCKSVGIVFKALVEPKSRLSIEPL